MWEFLKSLFSGRSPLPADPEQALAEAERLIESSPKEAWSLLRKLGRQRPELFALGRPLASRYGALIRRAHERERGKPRPSPPAVAVILGQELPTIDFASLWKRAEGEEAELLLVSFAARRDAFAEAMAPLLFAEDRHLALVRLDEEGSFVVRRQILLAMRGQLDPRVEELGPAIEDWARRQRLTVSSLG